MKPQREGRCYPVPLLCDRRLLLQIMCQGRWDLAAEAHPLSSLWWLWRRWHTVPADPGKQAWQGILLRSSIPRKDTTDLRRRVIYVFSSQHTLLKATACRLGHSLNMAGAMSGSWSGLDLFCAEKLQVRKPRAVNKRSRSGLLLESLWSHRKPSKNSSQHQKPPGISVFPEKKVLSNGLALTVSKHCLWANKVLGQFHHGEFFQKTGFFPF